MTTNFPTSLDSLTNPVGTDPTTSPDHAAQHANANDAIEALEAKVGIDGSGVVSSMDLRSRSRSQKISTSTFTNVLGANVLFTFTIPQNEPKAGDLYRLTLWGALLNNVGSSQPITWYQALGGSNLMASVVSYGSSATERGWHMVVELLFTATNAERITAHMLGTATGQAADGAMGLFGSSESAVGYGTGTVDTTTAARAFEVKAAMGTASTSMRVDCRGGVLERIAA